MSLTATKKSRKKIEESCSTWLKAAKMGELDSSSISTDSRNCKLFAISTSTLWILQKKINLQF